MGGGVPFKAYAASQGLCCGVASALSIMSDRAEPRRPRGGPTACTAALSVMAQACFDENECPVGNDSLGVFRDESPADARECRVPHAAFATLVLDLTDRFALSDAELVTAYAHFEKVLRQRENKYMPLNRVRPLFIACVAVAVKTLDDEATTVAEIADALSEMGYHVPRSRLAEMERALLDALDFQIDHCTLEAYSVYRRALHEEGRAVRALRSEDG